MEIGLVYIVSGVLCFILGFAGLLVAREMGDKDKGRAAVVAMVTAFCPYLNTGLAVSGLIAVAFYFADKFIEGKPAKEGE